MALETMCVPWTGQPWVNFGAALLIGLTGAAAMVLWIFINAMYHAGLHDMPLWYTGSAILLASSGLFIRAARVTVSDSRGATGFRATAYLFAVIAVAFALWGFAVPALP